MEDMRGCPCDALPGSALCSRDLIEALQLGTTMSDTGSAVQSPCIGNCCLDDDLTCLGCLRSLEEIKEWGLVDDRRRRVILQNAGNRKVSGQMPGANSPSPTIDA
jgi:predicted Fe-S protein YdhL (DUF1289 family)